MKPAVYLAAGFAVVVILGLVVEAIRVEREYRAFWRRRARRDGWFM